MALETHSGEEMTTEGKGRPEVRNMHCGQEVRMKPGNFPSVFDLHSVLKWLGKTGTVSWLRDFPANRRARNRTPQNM